MIKLTPTQQKFVDQQIASGAFRDSTEVIQAALELFQNAAAREAAETIADVRHSHEDIQLGRGISVDEAFGRIRKELGLPE